MTETLDHKLAALKLGRMRQVYASWIEQAAQTEMGYGEFLEQLVTEEVLARQENQLRRKMHTAGFPYAATIDQFDFALRPELKRTVMLRFFDSSFIGTASSLLLIGASGLGKTHLAVALGTKMVQLGYSVRFVMAQHIANAVLTATTRSQITRLIEPLVKCDLLILDEFGYLSMEPQVGPVLYEIISGRYQKGATVITSNKSLASWGELVGDTALMMAIIDRLLHHGEVMTTKALSRTVNQSRSQPEPRSCWMQHRKDSWSYPLTRSTGKASALSSVG
jgi:DNA replication protein DnaC